VKEQSLDEPRAPARIDGRLVNKVSVFIYRGRDRIVMQYVVMQHCMYIFFH